MFNISYLTTTSLVYTIIVINEQVYTLVNVQRTNNFDIEYGLVHGYKRIDIAPMIKVNYGNVFVAPAATVDDVGLVLGYEVQVLMYQAHGWFFADQGHTLCTHD